MDERVTRSALPGRPVPSQDDRRATSWAEPPPLSACLARPESVWRERPQTEPARSGGRVVMSQWRGDIGHHALELESDNADEHHALSICHRRPDADLIIEGRVVWTGRGAYDPFVLTGPRESRWEAVFRSAYETLRVYIPQSLIAECHTEMFGRPPAGSIKLFSADALRDPRMRRLAQVFRLAYASEEPLGPIFLDSLGMAFTCQMLRTYCVSATLMERATTSATPTRFNEVTDYIEDNLALSLDLGELSQISGLSKMYFASQFKKALGMSPHAYIIHRRILRAQDLLARTDDSVMAIALSLGFAGHSHLTTTFNRHVGRTPEQWRREQRG